MHKKAQELVRRGGDSLSWMTLWANNQYWFNSTETVAVAYQVHSGVAVTVGGPVGDRPGTMSRPWTGSWTSVPGSP